MRLLTITLALLLAPAAAATQTVTFTSESVEYVLELPSARWRAAPRLDVHEHFEFIHGDDRGDGYLRVREHLVRAGTTPEDLFRREQSRVLMSLPGYVGCSPCAGERFEGALSGAVFAYEYTTRGRPMAGRVYYLQVDGRKFYSLHFTADSAKLRALKGQTDLIADSFRLK